MDDTKRHRAPEGFSQQRAQVESKNEIWAKEAEIRARLMTNACRANALRAHMNPGAPPTSMKKKRRPKKIH
jgi:hypothetical protein